MCTLQIVLSLFVVNKKNGLVMYCISLWTVNKQKTISVQGRLYQTPLNGIQSLCMIVNSNKQLLCIHLSTSTNLESIYWNPNWRSTDVSYTMLKFQSTQGSPDGQLQHGKLGFLYVQCNIRPKIHHTSSAEQAKRLLSHNFRCPQSISKMLTRSAILAAVVSLHCSPNTVYLLLTFSSISFSWPSLLPTCRTEPTTRRSSSTGCPSTRSPPP